MVGLSSFLTSGTYALSLRPRTCTPSRSRSCLTSRAQSCAADHVVEVLRATTLLLQVRVGLVENPRMLRPRMQRVHVDEVVAISVVACSVARRASV